ncbi:CBS domain-containing protein [Desulfurispora thermophila]|uniref:CBS domain-containing protein n=1 Tax=Desulfurispora thermophila TaxID=265470 RepID=UPI000382D663|nr:CBS domain-containing protein [Desulfurispora thermophila]
MRRMLAVKQIMVPLSEYPVISEQATVRQAMDVLRSFFHQRHGVWYGFWSLLVLDRTGRPAGILTLRGFLKALQLQRTLEIVFRGGDPTGLFMSGLFDQKMAITVRNIMRPIRQVWVSQEENILAAALRMLSKNVNSLPVFAGEELVGILRTVDLFWYIGELLEDA